MAMTSAGVLVKRRNPGDKAALERLRVERGENIAQMIMRRRAVCERPEPAQKIELLLAKTGDVGEGLRPRQHRQQAQQQDLIERIDDFPGLTLIRHIFEIAEKSRRLGQSLEVPSARVHRNPPKIESEDSDKFSSDAYCHLLLHPIALMVRPSRVAVCAKASTVVFITYHRRYVKRYDTE